ncbi:hypothetical protein Patl1_36177 [Pistacia atlantica]|nr:hypothetical protein Patl1_36177 [Pistacia atlantica]
MASSTDSDIAKEFPFFRVYKDGRVELFRPHWDKIPPSDDPITGVRSKDVTISSEASRIRSYFHPKTHKPYPEVPSLTLRPWRWLLHAFCLFSTLTIHFCSTVSAQAGVIVVSVEYGLFPARPIPACYEDSWAALQWVASHVNGNGPDPWLNDHANFSKVFIGGDSAGGNISHTLAFRVGSIGLPGVKVDGVILFHPYFGGTEDDQMWLFMNPTNGGLKDPPAETAGRGSG